LSWAVVLIEKSGKSADIVEVLSSRVSSYKEVGEYKKAIADCTKVLHYILTGLRMFTLVYVVFFSSTLHSKLAD
jgi:hypothetical protein